MSAAGIATQPVLVLYSNHHGWLYGWLRRKRGNTSDTADLAQDIVVRLMVSRRLPAQLGDEP